MKTYSVTIPICGYAILEVEAEDEDKAIDKALEQEITMEDIQEWDAHRHIVKGNVFYGSTREAEATEV